MIQITHPSTVAPEEAARIAFEFLKTGRRPPGFTVSKEIHGRFIYLGINTIP